MFNLDTVTSENDNKTWPYRMLTIGPSGSLNLIQQDNSIIQKIYLYEKDLKEPKYKFLIKKCEDIGKKYLNDLNAFVKYSNTMDDVYNNIDDYNSKRKRKVLIVLDDMIPDIMNNERFQTIIKELFIRCRKLNISPVFITQCYFNVPKKFRLNSTHYLIMKIHNRRELQQIAINHSADINCKDFLKIYRNCTKEPFSFLTINTTLPANDPMRFRKNFSDSPL